MSRQLTILVVDDDAWQCDSYTRIVHTIQARIYATHNAQGAVKLLEVHRFDCLILDVILEGNTAFTLLHELQSDQALSRLPVIVCTNLADQVDSTAVSAYGVRRVLDKSHMRPEDIIAAVKAVTA